jgi:hypothetical protein
VHALGHLEGKRGGKRVRGIEWREGEKRGRCKRETKREGFRRSKRTWDIDIYS